MKKEPKLKPCPFCGCIDVFVKNPDSINVFSVIRTKEASVICSGCGMACNFGTFGTAADSEGVRKFAAIHWNRRCDNGGN